MNITDPRPPDEEGRELTLLALLQRVWTYSLTTKSDIAREYADEIAEGASRGFLTTEVIPGAAIFGRLWKITPPGISHLWLFGTRIREQEVSNYVDSFTTSQSPSA